MTFLDAFGFSEPNSYEERQQLLPRINQVLASVRDACKVASDEQKAVTGFQSELAPHKLLRELQDTGIAAGFHSWRACGNPLLFA